MSDNDKADKLEVYRDVPIVYVEHGFGLPHEWMEYLLAEIPWERRSDAPRSECYFNDNLQPYTYGVGRGVRTYEAHPFDTTLHMMRMNVEAAAEEVYNRDDWTFEALFLNRYHDQSDHLGWHADDSPEMDDERPIAIVSFGVEREIMFRPNNDHQNITRVVLQSGSICFMNPGMQDTHQHRIPKAGFVCGERISLTFRGFVEQK